MIEFSINEKKREMNALEENQRRIDLKVAELTSQRHFVEEALKQQREMQQSMTTNRPTFVLDDGHASQGNAQEAETSGFLEKSNAELREKTEILRQSEENARTSAAKEIRLVREELAEARKRVRSMEERRVSMEQAVTGARQRLDSVKADVAEVQKRAYSLTQRGDGLTMIKALGDIEEASARIQTLERSIQSIGQVHREADESLNNLRRDLGRSDIATEELECTFKDSMSAIESELQRIFKALTADVALTEVAVRDEVAFLEAEAWELLKYHEFCGWMDTLDSAEQNHVSEILKGMMSARDLHFTALQQAKDAFVDLQRQAEIIKRHIRGKTEEHETLMQQAKQHFEALATEEELLGVNADGSDSTKLPSEEQRQTIDEAISAIKSALAHGMVVRPERGPNRHLDTVKLLRRTLPGVEEMAATLDSLIVAARAHRETFREDAERMSVDLMKTERELQERHSVLQSVERKIAAIEKRISMAKSAVLSKAQELVNRRRRHEAAVKALHEEHRLAVETLERHRREAYNHLLQLHNEEEQVNNEAAVIAKELEKMEHQRDQLKSLALSAASVESEATQAADDSWAQRPRAIRSSDALHSPAM
jgi:chromosome segregation ATPase